MAVVRSVTNLTGGAAGGMATSQFPEFYQQYIQRLGGRLDQALIQMERVELAAAEEGLTVDQYIAHFVSSDDGVVRREGTVLLEQVEELAHLQDSMDALLRAPLLERPLAFAAHADQNIIDATTASFVPAVPVSVEGLAYALVGAILALVMLAAGAGLFRSVWPKAA